MTEDQELVTRMERIALVHRHLSEENIRYLLCLAYMTGTKVEGLNGTELQDYMEEATDKIRWMSAESVNELVSLIQLGIE